MAFVSQLVWETAGGTRRVFHYDEQSGAFIGADPRDRKMQFVGKLEFNPLTGRDELQDHVLINLRTPSPRKETASAEPLVEFLYRLMRDHVPTGVVQKLTQESIQDDQEPEPTVRVYTNGFLADYAKQLAKELTGRTDGK
jgi:hypothetical protein